MKVLFYEPMVAWVSPHFETALELMQQHLDNGDEIEFLGCNSDLKICQPNYFEKKATVCLECISKRSKGLSLLSESIIQSSFLNLTDNDKEELCSLRYNFGSIYDLKKYSIDEFDIGYAVASSLIFRVRDPEPSMEDHVELIRRLIDSAYMVYKSFLNHLRKHQCQRVYIFNGRFAEVRGVLRACQKMGVECATHERGHDIQHYALYFNTLPHDRTYFTARALEAWEQADKAIRDELAGHFYSDLRYGKERRWHSFTKNHEKGLLPESWDENKKNIVIFNSSEFELSGIGDMWNNPLYESQQVGLKNISNSMRHLSEKYHIWLRVHPYLSGDVNSSIAVLDALEDEHFSVIPADSPISTYSLIDAAEKVLTFGSTVGIEAAYWGKVSILAGVSFYRDLGSVYTPKSHSDLIDMLSVDLDCKDRAGALIYGYYR